MMEKPTLCICSIFLTHSSIADLGWVCNCEQCYSKQRCARILIFFLTHLVWNLWGKYKGVLYTTESNGISMASFCLIGLFLKILQIGFHGV